MPADRPSKIPGGPRRRARATAAPASPAVSEASLEADVDRFELRLGALGRADADVVDVSLGAVGGIRAGSVQAERSVVGGVLAGDVEVSRGIARTVIARDVRLSRSFARAIVAGTVRIERATGVGVLIARRVEGDVRVLFGWRSAAAFGAALGVVVGLVRATLGRRRGKAG